MGSNWQERHSLGTGPRGPQPQALDWNKGKTHGEMGLPLTSPWKHCHRRLEERESMRQDRGALGTKTLRPRPPSRTEIGTECAGPGNGLRIQQSAQHAVPKPPHLPGNSRQRTHRAARSVTKKGSSRRPSPIGLRASASICRAPAPGPAALQPL